jgi:hypothetical protein
MAEIVIKDGASDWAVKAIQQFAQRRQAKAECDMRVFKLESELYAAQNIAFFETLEANVGGGKWGLDLGAILGQNKEACAEREALLNAEYADIRANQVAMVKEEALWIDEMRDKTVDVREAWYEEHEGNPFLRFRQEWAHWVQERQNDGSFDSNWDVSNQYHMRFWPRVYVYTGGSCAGRTVDFSHYVVFRHPGLVPGRGNFRVQKVHIDLSGSGYSEVRHGDHCGIQGPANWGNTQFWLYVSLMEFPSWHQHQAVSELIHDRSSNGTTNINLLGEMEYSDCDFVVENPDNGGGECLAYVELNYRAFNVEKYGRSELTFTEEDTSGVGLRLDYGVTFEGEYE